MLYKTLEVHEILGSWLKKNIVHGYINLGNFVLTLNRLLSCRVSQNLLYITVNCESLRKAFRMQHCLNRFDHSTFCEKHLEFWSFPRIMRISFHLETGVWAFGGFQPLSSSHSFTPAYEHLVYHHVSQPPAGVYLLVVLTPVLTRLMHRPESCSSASSFPV